MPDIAPPTTSPLLTDLATRINSEFAAIQKADQDANKTIVQRAITFGRALGQAKEKVGNGKWEKWLNDNCRDISVQDYDRAENKLVEKLEALSPDTGEAAATETVDRLKEAVARIKAKLAAA